MNVRSVPIPIAIAIAIVIAVAALAPLDADAQGRPAPQRVLSRGLPDRPASQHVLPRGVTDRVLAHPSPLVTHKNDKVLYGRIEEIHGNVLLVRARSGRVQSVDASDAIASGMYSAPLFVGKLILVTGYTDSAKVLHAQSVTRETRLDASTAPDH